MGLDVISYGIANKAAKEESSTRGDTLGAGIQGTYAHAKARVDAVESSLQNVVAKANKLIIDDAVNIIKANAKFNVASKTMRYKHQNMIFEDFLDASGIDAVKSSGYTLDATNGLVKASGAAPYTIITTVELADTIPNKAVLVVEEGGGVGQNAIPQMTSNTAPSGLVECSTQMTGGHEAYRAFDKDFGPVADWSTDSNNPLGWISYQFPQPKVIIQYTITAGSNGPKTWTFDGWDGTKWVTLDTQTNVPSYTSSNEKRAYSITNTKAYQKYRVNVTENQKAAAALLSIVEIEMMEQANSMIQGTYFISRDGGATFEPITPESLFYFTAKSPVDKKLVLKAVLPTAVPLLNYGLTWS